MPVTPEQLARKRARRGAVELLARFSMPDAAAGRTLCLQADDLLASPAPRYLEPRVNSFTEGPRARTGDELDNVQNLSHFQDCRLPLD
jgi:hypothetical protein